jgi:hypothetical protein
MPSFRSRTVNLCPDDPALWQADPAGARGRYIAPGLGEGSPFALTLDGPGQWKSVPRHVEPGHPYLLECEVRGRGRIGLIWVREGRALEQAESAEPGGPQLWTSPDDGPKFARLTEMGAAWSEEVRSEDWRRVTVRGVSPVAANRVQVVLESRGDGSTSFDAPYLDGLGAIPVEIHLPPAYHPKGSKVAVVAVREPADGGAFEVLAGGQVICSGGLERRAGGSRTCRTPRTGRTRGESDVSDTSDRSDQGGDAGFTKPAPRAGEVCAQLEGEYIWGREYWYADFSALETAGSYRLRVALTDGVTETSQEFEINPEVYRSLPNLTLGWYYTQRCGMEVPGWHPACHLDDALIGRSRNRPLGPGGEWDITGPADLTGGWHDAGDNHKYICWSYLALWGLARLQGIQTSELRRLGEALPDPLAEAAWEARFLLKTVSDDGLFPLGVVSRFGWLNTPIHQETDNIPDTGDERALPAPEERICDIPTYGPEFTSALVASSLADLGVALRGYDDELSQRCLATARRTWERQHTGEPRDAEYLRWHAAFALLDASLYRAEPRDELQLDLEGRIARIVAQQKPEGIFPFPRECADYREQVLGAPREERAKLPYLSPVGARYAISHEACGIDYIPAPFTYLHALLDYLDLFPEGPQAGGAERALGLAMDFAQSLCARTPYGQMMEWTFAPDPSNFVHMFHGYDCALLSLAVVACRAARALARRELLRLAEQQVQWVLGRNPRGTSLVSGVGHKQLGIYHTGLSHYPEHRTGEQPGGVVNGFVSMGAPRVTYSGAPYPWDFPYLDVRSPAEEAGWLGVDADWWTNETWVPNCSWFILATVALHRALSGSCE